MNYHDIYKILIKAGAYSDDEDSFVRHFENNGIEWRFSGKLGFGGKYWRGNYVNCYREDETPARRKLIDEVNRELKQLEMPQ